MYRRVEIVQSVVMAPLNDLHEQSCCREATTVAVIEQTMHADSHLGGVTCAETGEVDNAAICPRVVTAH